MAMGDRVNLVAGERPSDYHCDCEFCRVVIGNLRPEGGGEYSRLERREYYSAAEQGEEGHVAKTPLHVARWAIQAYTAPGDWVLDPTIGAGTTAVEAITQGRSVAGMEVQFSNILQANVMAAYGRRIGVSRGSTARTASVNGKKRTLRDFEDLTSFNERIQKAGGYRDAPERIIRIGDARRIGAMLDENSSIKFNLVINNPPYSGDEHFSSIAKDKGRHQSGTFKYRSDLPNLAFLKEGREYWDAMADIYSACADHMVSGGHLVTGIKDMMRNKQPFLLHKMFCEMIRDRVGLEFVGTAFLKHHPRTQFLNTYFKFYGVHPPYYQTISVFRKRS